MANPYTEEELEKCVHRKCVQCRCEKEGVMDSVTIDRLDKRINDIDFKYHEKLKEFDKRLTKLEENVNALMTNAHADAEYLASVDKILTELQESVDKEI